MRAKLGSLLMVLGTMLVLGSLTLFLYNQHDAKQAEQSVQDLLPQLIQQIQPDSLTDDSDEETIYIPENLPSIYLEPDDFVMTEGEIDGHSYIGYLSIPKLELELPIMSKWDYPSLKIAPCRYTGTVRGEDLVLMAHNYARHFGRLSELVAGDSVYFVDMDGDVTAYEVIARDILVPTAVEEMTSGAFDLTLFTCTYGGQNRVTVYCDMAQSN